MTLKRLKTPPFTSTIPVGYSFTPTPGHSKLLQPPPPVLFNIIYAYADLKNCILYPIILSNYIPRWGEGVFAFNSSPPGWISTRKGIRISRFGRVFLLPSWRGTKTRLEGPFLRLNTFSSPPRDEIPLALKSPPPRGGSTRSLFKKPVEIPPHRNHRRKFTLTVEK